MKELSEMRAQGEAATRRRSRSAQAVAKKSRRAPSVRPVGPPRRPVAAPQAKPTTLGRFQIGPEIGRSRSGTLYRSSLPPSDKPVDVLALPDELTRDRRFLDRFWREMRIVSELDHENLLGVIDVGESNGVQYVAYEHLEGESLADLLKKEESLPAERALDIIRGVVAGLMVATKNGIVHGDLKPSNVMVSSDGKVKLAGLGLARGSDDDASSLNERGRIEHYGAPEQILAQGRDARSDVYSAGALFLKMLTGKAPLEVGSLSEARGLVQLSELPRPEELTDLSSGLRGVLSKTLAEKPDDRYKSLANLATALKRVKS
jgi:serine/threonine-protein kinase